MKIYYNKFIPFKGYVLINLFGVLFARKEYEGKITNTYINHELIHTRQMRELLYLPFYILYCLEWLFRYFFTEDAFSHKAYRNISFEREAYKNERNVEYLKTRKRFSQWRDG